MSGEPDGFDTIALMRIAIALLLLPLTLGATTKKPKPAPTAAATPDPQRQAAFDAKVGEAKADADKDDLLDARNAWRTAQTLAATPDEKKTADEGYASVEKDCIDDAKHHISEAKAYLAADNPGEASKSIELALKYADKDSDKEHQTAMDLKKQIRRNE